ncbi:MAG: alpha/beta hydrolase [Alphaproteobacteria bacterium]
MTTLEDTAFESRFAQNGDVRIHYAATGPKDGPLVVMLHGFPDYWYTWRSLMGALEDKYRCCAMDLRGYNLSSQPKGVENYHHGHLVEDVAAVIKAEGRTSAIIIGHDWGAAISWNVAFRRPDLIDLLVILSVPHPLGMMRELLTNPEQQANSQYARNFQKDGSEDLLTIDQQTFWVTDEDAKPRYAAAFGRSDFAAMMNFYRANYPRMTADTPPPAAPPQLPKIKSPLLVLHGMQDKALHANGHGGVWNHAEQDVTLVFYPHSGHFIQQDVAVQANRAIRDWLDAQLELASCKPAMSSPPPVPSFF